jgi:hypothetical protein
MVDERASLNGMHIEQWLDPNQKKTTFSIQRKAQPHAERD